MQNLKSKIIFIVVLVLCIFSFFAISKVAIIHNNDTDSIEMLEKILPNLIKNSFKSFLRSGVVCEFCISSSKCYHYFIILYQKSQTNKSIKHY